MPKKNLLPKGVGRPTVPEMNRNKEIWNDVFNANEVRKLMMSYLNMAHTDPAAARYVFDRCLGPMPASVPEGSADLIASVLQTLAQNYYGAE